MKLLWLSGHFPNSTAPIRSVYNLQQAQALARHCEVRVVAPVQWAPVRLSHGAGPAMPPVYEEVGGLSVWHPRYVLTPGVARDSYAVQMGAALLPALGRIRREYPFDVLLATWAFPDVVVGAAAARLWNVPFLAKVHGSDVNVQAIYPARRRQIRWAMERAHRVLAVSGALRDRLREIGVPEEKILVYHNGVDHSRFRPGDGAAARRELGIDAPGRHIVFVGYLAEAKAIHVLIDAVSRLRGLAAEPVTAHLVGCGALEGELRAQADALGLQEQVRFHGKRNHEEIPRWMTAADVFCLPSIREGCPNVLLEALASGRPVVATRVGGIPELVGPENSILVPPSDAEALAAGLREALDRPWSPEALSASVAGFSWETSARALYEAACDALHRAPVRVPAGYPAGAE